MPEVSIEIRGEFLQTNQQQLVREDPGQWKEPR